MAVDSPPENPQTVDDDPGPCLCGDPSPRCPRHSPEAIEAAYRALGPAPVGCQCSRCQYERRPTLTVVPGWKHRGAL